jgi:solute carrier family 10 (sodium/bile acid cotransporter), member 7
MPDVEQATTPLPEQEFQEDEKTKEISSIHRFTNAIIWFIKDQWFLLGMGVVILIASQVQVPLAQQSIKQVTISYLSVSIIFFIAGCTLDTSTLLANYAKWKHHLFIQSQSFLLVSALAFAIVSLSV